MKGCIKQLKIIAFIILAMVNVFFAKNMLEEYLSGITAFHISHQALTTHDNPSVVVCFDLSDSSVNVGPNILFDVTQSKDNQTKTVEVKITKQETELHEIHIEFVWGRLTCFKLDPLANDLTQWTTTVKVKVKDGVTQSQLAFVFFTTEENSHGAILHKFFDGSVERLEIYPSWHYHFKLGHVTEFHLVNQKCTKEPYYQCLGSLLKASHECDDFGGLCNLMTLPGIELPSCTVEAYNCSEEVFWDILGSKKCKNKNERLCNGMVYDLEFQDYSYESVSTNEAHTYSFDYQLTLPGSSKGERMGKAYKTVKTEYFVLTGLSLTAHLGGMLSMTVEFSFIASLRLLLTLFTKACKRITPLSRDHAGLKILGHVLNIGLLILTGFFVWSTCSEYAAGETDFVLTKTPVTTKDNPTVTICFGGRGIIKFNCDFTAKYRYSNGSTWDVGEAMVRKISISETLQEEFRNCFMFKKISEDISGSRKMYIELYFKQDTLMFELHPWVYITSEENAFGIATQRWFDGEVYRFPLLVHKEFFVKLDSVHQYVYLKQSCTKNSFYECLMETMTRSGECSEHGGLCEAVSLPKVLPACMSDTDFSCALQSFWKAYNSCQQEKACTNMEYRINGVYGDIEARTTLELTENFNATFAFGYGFVSDASQERLIEPHKTVHREYLLWSEFTLVAYVGGMLGLTLGISLLDIYHWIMNRAGQIWARRCNSGPKLFV